MVFKSLEIWADVVQSGLIIHHSDLLVALTILGTVTSMRAHFLDDRLTWTMCVCDVCRADVPQVRGPGASVCRSQHPPQVRADVPATLHVWWQRQCVRDGCCVDV